MKRFVHFFSLIRNKIAIFMIMTVVVLPGISFGNGLKEISPGAVRDIVYSKSNKVTILVFWASWCSVCKKQLPEINSIYDRYKSKGVEIIGISLDDEDGEKKVRKFIKKKKISFPVYVARDKREMTYTYKITKIPTLVFYYNESGYLKVRKEDDEADYEHENKHEELKGHEEHEYKKHKRHKYKYEHNEYHYNNEEDGELHEKMVTRPHIEEGYIPATDMEDLINMGLW